MNINIICVGKVKESFYRDAINEFTKRLSKYCKVNIYEVADEKTPDKASEAEENKILQKEGERIQKHMKEDDYVFALAIEGKKYDSVSFAKEYIYQAIRLGANYEIGKGNGPVNHFWQNNQYIFDL